MNLSISKNICLDNIIFSLQRSGGISVYWSELWSRLLRDNISVIAIEAGHIDKNIFRAAVKIPTQQIMRDKRPIKISRFLYAPVSYKRTSLLHSSYYRKPSNFLVPTVQTCYDFTDERFRKESSQWIHSFQKRRAVSAATGVICISESTRRDLLYYCPKVLHENTCVIHLGYSDAFGPLPEGVGSQLVAPYIAFTSPFSVFVGSRIDYKNFNVAVDAISLCPDHRLVVVGGGPLRKEEYEYLEGTIRDRWLHIDKAPSTLLNALYNQAHALIYPSSYEGFGIPVIEAMAAGCPVIALSGSSILEVAGDAGLLIDHADPAAVANQLQRLEDKSIRNDALKRGLENVKRFSWERCYQETLSFYSRVLNQIS